MSIFLGKMNQKKVKKKKIRHITVKYGSPQTWKSG